MFYMFFNNTCDNKTLQYYNITVVIIKIKINLIEELSSFLKN